MDDEQFVLDPTLTHSYRSPPVRSGGEEVELRERIRIAL